MTNSTEIPVVCAIIEKDGMILAAKRGVNQSNAGLWEFPGGKVHSGETSEQALRREIREELAVEINIVKQLEPVSYRYPWIFIRLIPFICSISQGEPEALEHAQVGFFNRKDCSKILWSPADIKVMEQYWESVRKDLD
ncbi:MAG: (deoxy)nucleoside triphosphate pyrophosphohydrolase [Fibrobacter sp.]|nr:(deoxy)nucleoside triphosphate pyrophosphohydrolase [Fibrobacter sp.]